MPRAGILKSTRRGLGIRAGVFNKSGLLGVDRGGSARTSPCRGTQLTGSAVVHVD